MPQKNEMNLCEVVDKAEVISQMASGLSCSAAETVAVLMYATAITAAGYAAEGQEEGALKFLLKEITEIFNGAKKTAEELRNAKEI